MRQLIAFIAFVFIFSSCSNHSKNDLAVFKATTNGLEQSSKVINQITTDYRNQLFEMLNDPRLGGQPAIWQPKAASVSELSFSTIAYIDKLKSRLVEATGNRISDKASVFESNNFKAVNKVFFQQNKGVELYRQLRNFIDTIYSIDRGLYDYSRLVREKFDYLDSVKYNDKAFSQTFFDQVSAPAALSILAKFENDIRNLEKEIVTYYYNRSFPGCNLQYVPFKIIVAQSSNIVKTGDDIEITAGVGAFSIPAQPKFTIDGKLTLSDENGILAYKFKTPLKAGKYTKTLKMEYSSPDGTRESVSKNIEYTVIEEK